MPPTWNGTLSIVRSEPLSLPDFAWPVEIRTHPRARFLRLKVDEQRGVLTLTCPKRVGRAAALNWARRQGDWVEAQLAGIEPGEPFLSGATILLEGRTVTLLWDERLPRAPALRGDVLGCGGTHGAFAARIERYLKASARLRLSVETASAAEAAGVTVRSIAVGDASTRWGSCSSSGSIRFNWRLILAPPHLLRWVVAHEVAHRRHMNHGPQFRALEASLYAGNVAAARSELRALGPRLKRIGRSV